MFLNFFIRLKRGKEVKKGSVAPSATDVAERVENMKKKKEKKEDKNLEEKVKFCRPGKIKKLVPKTYLFTVNLFHQWRLLHANEARILFSFH